MNKATLLFAFVSLFIINSCKVELKKEASGNQKRVEELLKKMTLDEKLGQMIQQNAQPQNDSLIKAGRLGSILNEVNVNEINRLQKLAVEETRLGIPLLFGRDVIHGFNTIFPIPLAQASSWNPELVREAAHIAAVEARSSGINWTFAPMIDVTRDPRWGRIAEGFGEDPFLTSAMAKASVEGYQQHNLGDKFSIASCAKHFAAYGAAEAGRDYHTVTLPENELRDVYFPPFQAAIDAGVATFMTAFNEINGVPASGNSFLFRQVLRDEWKYTGMVVSDWSSISQLVVHGVAENNEEAAYQAAMAGVDMEMASNCYHDYLKELVESGRVPMEYINQAVRNILTLKFDLGLFENPYVNPAEYPATLNDEHKTIATSVAEQSIVLLKNNSQLLPLSKEIRSVAVIGPLADAAHDQMGTWVFDGKKVNSVTPYESIKNLLGAEKVNFAKGMEISRTMTKEGFDAAIRAARRSDVVILFLGEESILSGESHCRADISFPGLQNELVEALAQTGKPIVGIIMAGRPLTFETQAEKMSAILYAWHPGNMAGPALAKLIFGETSPSGKLPITFPHTVGQIPVYYAGKNSGKPATEQSWEKMYDIGVEVFQLSIGNTNHYIDYGYKPWFPFGYGLSYSTFEYSNPATDKTAYAQGDSIKISATLKNTGNYEAAEVAQLYIRDVVGSRTRPVKQLKGFQKINLKPGEETQVQFSISTNELGFYNLDMNYVTEPGEFKAGIGTHSDIELPLTFSIQ